MRGWDDMRASAPFLGVLRLLFGFAVRLFRSYSIIHRVEEKTRAASTGGLLLWSCQKGASQFSRTVVERNTLGTVHKFDSVYGTVLYVNKTRDNLLWKKLHAETLLFQVTVTLFVCRKGFVQR